MFRYIKMKTSVVLCIVFYVNLINCNNRVAPGVPPQQYQHQPHQPQQYQQQQQYQHQQHQQHQQFQQPNPGQFQQPAHHDVHHQPTPGHHGHGQPHQQSHVLSTGNLEHEKEHIAEHLDIPIDTKDMTNEQLQFHYFRMHDADANNKLDGCELIKSLIHWHEQGSKGGGNNIEEKIFKDEDLVTLIDPILNMDDINRDGYIDYPEFIQAQRRAVAAGAPSQQ